jgi:hypothetical protein
MSLSNVKPFENLMAKLSDLTAQELIELENLVAVKQLDGRHDLTASFEEIFGEGKSGTTFKEFDFTRETDPLKPYYYKDTVTCAARDAFLNVIKEMRRHVVRRITSKKQVRGPFIVGRTVEDDTVQFGYRPFSHNSAIKATVEADRLVARHGGQYVVFGSLMVVGKGRQPAEQTKQGVKVVKPNPSRVMADLQEFRKKNPLELSPADMMMTQEGNIKVIAFINEEPVTYTFDTFDEYIEYINNWLKATKMLLKTESQ